MNNIKYPVGVQTFSKIIENNYLYVDKTEYVYQLVTNTKYCFLSRPRRFGKSLFLSTLESLFLGKKELFEGLAISSKDWEWEEYPVFHLDLTGKTYKEIGHLRSILSEYLTLWESRYRYSLEGKDADERFRTLVRRAFETTGRQVVILVDEYDQPLLKTLDNPELQETFRSELQAFYVNIKTLDRYIRFAMLSGVSKFSKVSVFSGLNNLKDISLEPRYNAICGVSESELQAYFEPGITKFSEVTGIPEEKVRVKLKEDYDGYHFCAAGEGIYNPFSLLNTFDNDRFSDYWFDSGTPEMLVKLLKTRNYKLSDLSRSHCTETDLKGSDVFLENPIPLLYQTGYLTIKGYDQRFGLYILDFPNREVKESFFNYLTKFYLSKKSLAGFSVFELVESVEQGDAERFMLNIQSFFADFPNDQLPDLEVHYQNVMYIVMKLMGFYVRTEYKTSRGRIDMVIKTNDYIYVIELKLNGTAEEAMRQIEERGYCNPFQADHRDIIRIGASFDSKTHELVDYIIR